MKPKLPNVRFNKKEAERLCPSARQCDKAQEGACTLADVSNWCSINKRLIKALIEEPTEEEIQSSVQFTLMNYPKK